MVFSRLKSFVYTIDFIDCFKTRGFIVIFDSIKYMEWFKGKQPVKYDLCYSSVKNISLSRLEVDWEKMELTGQNVYGYIPLLESIAQKYNVETENVVSVLGTSQGLFVVCAALLQKGDRVLVERPTYEPLLAVSRSFEAEITRFERPYAAGYQVDLDDLKNRISQDTKLIILTDLHNPSGVHIPQSEMEEILCVAEEVGAWVLLDGVYGEFLDRDSAIFPLKSRRKVILISSLTKAYGLGGIRCGWVIAPMEIVRSIKRIIDHMNVEGTYLTELISVEIMSKLEEIKSGNSADILRNLNRVRDLIEKEDGLSWIEPDGGVVCFPRVEGKMTGDDLSRILRRDYDTAVVPGRFFEAPQHFRLGFGVPPDILDAGLENIRKALR
ncbi:pyridoxal phosphate-dependent aminotransferase [Acidobacteriota bacterium]